MPAMPGPVPDEREGLLSFLDQQRYVLRIAAYGLTDDQARESPTVSSLCLGGLIKHCTFAERYWIGVIGGVERRDVAGYQSSFTMDADESLLDLVADNERAGLETSTTISEIADLGQAVPVPQGSPWAGRGVDAWSVRWVLLHLIEEVARHAGHADIVREAIDGATGVALMAAQEGWPPMPWVTPWAPVVDS